MHTSNFSQPVAIARITAYQTVMRGQLVNVWSLEQNHTVKEAIILLHGWRSEGAVWHGVMQQLVSEQTALYALDLPGFGRSDPPKTPFDVNAYAEIVYAFIQQNRIEHATIIGHSFGGRIAIRCAVKYTNLVKQLVLVDSAGIREQPRKTVRMAAQLVKPFFRLPGFRAIRPHLYHLIGADDYLATPTLQQTFLRVINENLALDFPAIRCPTLIVWGSRDKETPVRMGQIMTKKIPNSRFIVLQEAGHFCFLDRPDQFIAAVKQFLRKQQ